LNWQKKTPSGLTKLGEAEKNNIKKKTAATNIRGALCAFKLMSAPQTCGQMGVGIHGREEGVPGPQYHATDT